MAANLPDNETVLGRLREIIPDTSTLIDCCLVYAAKSLSHPILPDILCNMLFLIDVARQIAKERRAVGLTQSELARMARVSRSTLDALENGRMGELGYSKVNNILTALGLEFTVAKRTPARPTLDELMIENERENDSDHRSLRHS